MSQEHPISAGENPAPPFQPDWGDKQRIRKLIRPAWPYSWMDEHWELVRYVFTLLVVYLLLTVLIGGVLLVKALR